MLRSKKIMGHDDFTCELMALKTVKKINDFPMQTKLMQEILMPRPSNLEIWMSIFTYRYIQQHIFSGLDAKIKNMFLIADFINFLTKSVLSIVINK